MTDRISREIIVRETENSRREKKPLQILILIERNKVTEAESSNDASAPGLPGKPVFFSVYSIFSISFFMMHPQSLTESI